MAFATSHLASILSNLSEFIVPSKIALKLIESLVLIRNFKYLKMNSPSLPNQEGFIPRLNTLTAYLVLSFMSSILAFSTKRWCVTVVFFLRASAKTSLVPARPFNLLVLLISSQWVNVMILADLASSWLILASS
ncbi:hypothetical protein WICPIJ_000261 [Wickerhamomyces pijperi]|uniref:Uncharacterized protein n=1 Tax=Wickerhamomyces pijperi TaxID=599730 RepID=A0A9P8QH97_WICPI|nr:hypothetical protein WICPIJ_000261 [Wickerhamomyces pijperi]